MAGSCSCPRTLKTIAAKFSCSQLPFWDTSMNLVVLALQRLLKGTNDNRAIANDLGASVKQPVLCEKIINANDCQCQWLYGVLFR